MLGGCATLLEARVGASALREPAPSELCSEEGERIGARERVLSIDTERETITPGTGEATVGAMLAAGYAPARYHLLRPADDSEGIVIAMALGGGLGALVALAPLIGHAFACAGPSACRLSTSGLEDYEVAMIAGGLSAAVLIPLGSLIALELAEDTPSGDEQRLGDVAPCE